MREGGPTPEAMGLKPIKHIDYSEKIDPTREQFSGTTLDFFFSPHGTKEDIRKLKKHIDAADAIAVENLYWDEDTKEALNFISKADIKDPEIQKRLQMICSNEEKKGSVFFAELLQQIAGTNKPIIFPDIPKDHALAEASKKLDAESEELGNQILNQFFEGNYHEAIETGKRVASILFQQQRMREEFIKQELACQIKKLKDNEPNFAKKKDIRVLVQYGDAHRTLFYDMRKAGVSTTVTAGYPLIISGYGDEIKRRMYFGNEIPEELYARNIFCTMYFGAIQRENPKMNIEQAILVTRQSLDRLTTEDIKDLSSQMGIIKSEDEKFAVMNSFLSEKGAIIPNTDKEIRNILGPMYTWYCRLGSQSIA